MTKSITKDTIQRLISLSAGIVICFYEFDSADVLAGENSKMDESSSSAPQAYSFYAVCWRGEARALNVMCSKVEVESMKHQLAALKVLRPKIASVNFSGIASSAPSSLPVTVSLLVEENEKTVDDLSFADNTSLGAMAGAMHEEV